MTEFEEKFTNGYFAHCVIEVDDEIINEFDVATNSLESLMYVLSCINEKVNNMSFMQQRALWINNGTYKDLVEAIKGGESNGQKK